MIKLCFDAFVNDLLDHPWPNLVPCTTDDVNYWPCHLSSTPPFSEFPRLVEYLREHDCPHEFYRVADADQDCFYIIDLYVFDHSIDFFKSMSDEALSRLKQRQFKLLIFYCEADSEPRIQKQIFSLCSVHDINPADVHLVMGHTVTAASPANFHYFDDDLLAYGSAQLREHNRFLSCHDTPRSKKTTILSRVHKNWRAYFHAWAWDQGHHKDSYFSYCMEDHGEDMNPENNPLHAKIKLDHAWQDRVDRFLSAAPFYADELDNEQRNDYHHRVDHFYNDSYWNIVLETHLSLEDNLPGVFLTEKTWKPIANGQAFVVLGNAGSLQYLRSLGFRTFWEIGINEDYDDVVDATDRFNAVCDVVSTLSSMSIEQLHQLNKMARPILEHNQKLFRTMPRRMLDTLIEDLTGDRLLHPSL